MKDFKALKAAVASARGAAFKEAKADWAFVGNRGGAILATADAGGQAAPNVAAEAPYWDGTKTSIEALVGSRVDKLLVSCYHISWRWQMAYYNVYRNNWHSHSPRTYSTAPKAMESLFAGVCKRCGQPFPKGTPVLWSKATGAVHATTEACALAVAAAPVVEATPSSSPSVTLNMAKVVEFLNGAKSRGLKFPKVRFASPVGGTLVLSLAGPRAKAPGSVKVEVEGRPGYNPADSLYGSKGEWFGRVETDGAVVGSKLLREASLLDTLARVAAEPAKLAAEYGALTGSCSFCGKTLTDAGSTEVGYGPVCAVKYGLPHHPKGTPTVSAVAA